MCNRRDAVEVLHPDACRCDGRARAGRPSHPHPHTLTCTPPPSLAHPHHLTLMPTVVVTLASAHRPDTLAPAPNIALTHSHPHS